MNQDDASDIGLAIFEGPCTCDHPPEQHTWGECDVTVDVNAQDNSPIPCPCTAGWWE